MTQSIDPDSLVRRYEPELNAIRTVLQRRKASFAPLVHDRILALHAQVPLPSEYIAFLAAIGTLDDVFEVSDGANPASIEEEWYDVTRAQMAAPFEVKWEHTAPVLAAQGFDTRYWLYESCCAYYQRNGILPADKTYTDLFGDPNLKNGRFMIGNSTTQNELFLIMNGEFAGQVWVDILGDETWSVFGPAAPTNYGFLNFMRESLERGGMRTGDHEHWMW